jgi:hypothetical protein
MRRLHATSATREQFGDWIPGRWRTRMRPSDMKFSGGRERRYRRCARWPDQEIGIGGDRVVEPIRVCPGCWERMRFRAVQPGQTTEEDILWFVMRRLADSNLMA